MLVRVRPTRVPHTPLRNSSYSTSKLLVLHQNSINLGTTSYDPRNFSKPSKNNTSNSTDLVTFLAPSPSYQLSIMADKKSRPAESDLPRATKRVRTTSPTPISREDFVPGLSQAYTEVSQIVDFVDLAIDLNAGDSFLDHMVADYALGNGVPVRLLSPLLTLPPLIVPSKVPPTPKSQMRRHLDSIRAALVNNNLWQEMAALSRKTMPMRSIMVVTRMRASLEEAKKVEEDLESALLVVIDKLDGEVNTVLGMFPPGRSDEVEGGSRNV